MIIITNLMLIPIRKEFSIMKNKQMTVSKLKLIKRTIIIQSNSQKNC